MLKDAEVRTVNKTKYGQTMIVKLFRNKQMKSWLKSNNTEIYSTHNKMKSVIVE